MRFRCFPLLWVACHASPPVHDPPPAVPEATAPADDPTPVALTPLGDGLWQHTSTRELPEFGTVPSHGLVVAGSDGAVLVDTAWGAAATTRLLELVHDATGGPPVAAIVTDFHDDRAAGVGVLQAAGVPVFSSPGVLARLPASARRQAHSITTPVFNDRFGDVDVEVFAPGPGHTSENLVVWLPDRRVLFGGCLVRPFESRSLGNVADADLDAWGPTIRAVRARYPSAERIVPSHGAPTGPEILPHTLALVEAGLAERARGTGADPPPTRVAITVDDLPQHGPLPRGLTRTEVHTRLLEAFEHHGIDEVRGFVIGRHADTNEDNAEALRRWVAAGHPLGNHTWSHPQMKSIGVDAFLEDLDRNEQVLAALTGDAAGETWRSFRYPYLHQGFDADSSARVRAHLAASGYQVAEVSIDFWDWDYQKPYARCLAAKSKSGVEALRKTYLGRAVEMLQWHRAAAQEAFGRPIAHVLLLHAGAFTAEMIEPLLDAYEARNVVWIDLEEALADPVYRDVPLPLSTYGDVIVEQAVSSLGVPHPPWPTHPGPLLAALCPHRRGGPPE